MNLRWLYLILFFVISTNSFSQINGSFVATKDAYTRSDIVAGNFGTDINLHAGLYPNRVLPGFPATFHVRRSAIECDISSIPSNAIITSAELRIYANAARVNFPVFKLSRNTASWTETGITWSNQPSFDLAEAVTFNGITSVGAIGVDVKTHVQKMVAGVYSNYGWTLSVESDGTGSGRSQDFSSNNHTSAGDRPTLVVNYYIPMSISNAVINHQSSSGVNDGSISPTLINGPGGTYSYQWYNSSGAMSGKTSLNLTGVPYGWYGLRVTSNVSGSVPFFYAFLVGQKCTQVNVDFNPGPDFVDDAGIYSSEGFNSYEYFNYGTLTTLRIAENNQYYEDYSAWENLLRFRVWIDNALVLNEATINLTGASFQSSSPTTNVGGMYRVTQNWNESFVTHSSMPNYSGTVSVPMPVVTGGVQAKQFNALEEFNHWKSNNLQNYGLLMRLLTYNHSLNSQYYFSSDNTTSTSYRPWVRFQMTLSTPTAPHYCDQTFAKLERKMTGVKYQPHLGYLYFYYDEEYATHNTQLNYKVFSVSNQLNPLLDGSVQSLSEIKYGDNRYTLNVSSLAIGTYILEVTNDKKEKFYLRFQKID